MKLFYQDRKIDERNTFELVRKAYGISNPAKVGGYAGTFLFTLGDVYVSDGIGICLARDEKLSEYLLEIIHRFIKEDYGNVSEADRWENIENRYFGGGARMKGKYPSEHGIVVLETLLEFTLLRFDAEDIIVPE